MASSLPKLSRRTLFAGAGTAGALTAAVSVLPGLTTANQAAAPRPAAKPEKGGGYALSEHVQRYYKTAQV